MAFRSKYFWAFACTTGAISSVIAYDRYKCSEVRKKFLAEAELLGMQPSRDSIRKVTLVAFGKDSYDLKKIKMKWRTYAVDIFTKAGCDYQWMEVNAASLNKEVDKLVPVPDGQLPVDSKNLPDVVNPKSWIKPTMMHWLRKLNKNGFEVIKASEDPTQTVLEKLWEERRPEPKNERFFDDGIVALDFGSYEALEEAVQEYQKEHGNDRRVISNVPHLGYVPCDPPLNWTNSIINVRL